MVYYHAHAVIVAGSKMSKDEAIEVDEKTKAVFNKKGYIVLKRIAGGNFGDVYKAKNLRRNELSAVKVMNLKAVEQKGLGQQNLDREIKALVNVRHENVLTVLDIFRAKGRLYIFMEFAPNGTLADKIKKSEKGYLSEEEARIWFTQCVDALCCMHSKHRIAHRDIKPDNVLLDAEDNAKLSDFGFSREWTLDTKLSKTYCGTPHYFAPEILAKRPYNPFISDVWSMGVMLFEMLNGNVPFKVSKSHRARSLKQMKDKDYRVNEEAWSELSDQVVDLINSMFTFIPDTRPNILAVRRHPWFSF